jgi:pimeloyl-ACP methyl ester carboxylesterase
LAVKSLQEPERRAYVLSPTGTYGVGRTTFRWVDPNREEVLTPASTDHRNVVAHVWYPAEPNSLPPATYVPDHVDLRRVFRGPEGRAWPQVRPAAAADAPVIRNEQFPVVMFSPGNQMLSALYSFLLEELASRGYIVVGIDHSFDVRAVRLADSSIVTFAAGAWPKAGRPDGPTPNSSDPSARFYRERVAVRTADIAFALDQLQRPALGQLNGRLDLSKIAVVGHSIGGVAAGEACRLDRRFIACINLDGSTVEGPFYADVDGWRSSATYLMLTKPFRPSDDLLKSWNSSRELWEQRRREHDRKYFGAVRGGGYRVVVEGATHETFSDDPVVIAASTRADNLPATRRLATTVRGLSVAFLDGVVMKGDRNALRELAAADPGVSLEVWDGTISEN